MGCCLVCLSETKTTPCPSCGSQNISGQVGGLTSTQTAPLEPSARSDDAELLFAAECYRALCKPTPDNPLGQPPEERIPWLHETIEKQNARIADLEDEAKALLTAAPEPAPARAATNFGEHPRLSRYARELARQIDESTRLEAGKLALDFIGTHHRPASEFTTMAEQIAAFLRHQEDNHG
jgi:hypothetical protein